jgi:hypothetical protein
MRDNSKRGRHTADKKNADKKIFLFFLVWNRYEGQFKEGSPHGWGLLRESSRHFLGRFQGGLPHGIGVLQVHVCVAGGGKGGGGDGF